MGVPPRTERVGRRVPELWAKIGRSNGKGGELMAKADWELLTDASLKEQVEKLCMMTLSLIHI